MSNKKILGKCRNGVYKTEKLCRTIISNQRNRNDIHRNIGKTRAKIQAEEKLVVLFLAQFPEMWNSEKSVFEKLATDNRYDVLVYAVPKYSNGENTDIYAINPMYEYLDGLGIPVINTKVDNGFIDIPDDVDFIFPQRPYDIYMPEKYHLRNLSRKGLICYIPYSPRLTKGIHIEIEFNEALLTYFYSIFADCEESYDYVRSCGINRSSLKYKRLYNIGYPRFDLVSSHKNSNRDKKKYLWTPRWSLSTSNDRTHFPEYIDTLLSFFEQHEDINLIIRPHPLMFSEFIEKGFMTELEIAELKDRIKKIKNISFDENDDYLVTFNECDVLISDLTSLLIEFFITGKPIIFCGSYNSEKSSLTDNAVDIYSTFYFVNNRDEMVGTITKLLNNNDPMKEKRSCVLKRFEKGDQNTAERIADILIKDVRGN